MKSNVSDYLKMAQAVYIDACAKCSADVSDLRDLETIRARIEDEGLSFVTITLPRFCDDFQKSLALGYIDPTYFQGFRKYGAIPAFLRGMLGLLFDHETGRIYEQTSDIASDSSTLVDSIRQICLAFKKIELDCSPARTAAALTEFVKIERSFSEFSLQKEDTDYFELVSSVLWDNVLADLRLDELVPRHGPGATADRMTGNQKYAWRSWHQRLEPYFPLIDNAYSISAYQSEELESVTLICQDDELPVKVTPVPKTLKGPRIIAIEPCCMQYVQQAIREVLYKTLESSWDLAGQINFSDQTKNQELAVVASRTGRFATIDLSEASDRVPLSLSLMMFRSNPDLKDAIEACRSTRAKLPDGTVIGPLKKFASMGSALCFPVESMYFYTICVAALLKIQNLPVSHANVLQVGRGVFVYGDDIIVPTTYAESVLEYLQKYYCKVNTSKTFYTGKFRESCGVDAYDGIPVTPVYFRQPRPENRQQVQQLISTVATANLFYQKGYWHTAQLLYSTVEDILGPLPYVSTSSAGLGRISFLGFRSVERWNQKLQRFEVKAWVPRPVYRTDALEGYAALQKCLSYLAGKTGDLMDTEFTVNLSGKFDITDKNSDEFHLERSALYGAVALQRRWVPSQQ